MTVPRTGEPSEERKDELSMNERSQILKVYTAALGKKGWEVETHGNSQAVMVSGRRVKHTLHAVLSLFTGGIWLPVWAGISIFGGEKRMLVSVDERSEGRINRL